MTHAQVPARIAELLCDRVLFGLDEREESELNKLLAHTGMRDPISFELAVTAVDLAVSGPHEALPMHLLASLEASARTVFASGAPSAATVPIPQAHEGLRAPAMAPRLATSDAVATAATVAVPQSPLPAPMTPPVSQPPLVAPPSAANVPVSLPPSAPRAEHAPPASGAVVHTLPRRRGGWLPWLAAAACFALAIGSAWWFSRPRLMATRALPEAPLFGDSTLSPSEARERLLGAKSAVLTKWKATTDRAATSASGDVVWDNDKQRGYMRFRGLAKNDPGENQYQLWIFDKGRDARFPVDGGVFDVDRESGDVVVAIAAKLDVRDPQMFAVTVEKPGGVVVSQRERIVLTATPGS
jgi:hypothetical protein